MLDALYRCAARLDIRAPRTWTLGNASINRLLWTPEGMTVIGWADTAHQLISCGHTWADVQGYSLGQIQAFTAAVCTAERAQMRNAMIAARAAQAEGKDFKKLMKDLT